jgi:hypothetical protein
MKKRSIISIICLLFVALYLMAQTHTQAVLDVAQTWTATQTFNSIVVSSCSGCGTLTIASGTSAMGTSAISSGTCATVVTATATGATTANKIIATPTVDPTGVTGYAPSASGSLYIQAFPTSGNVNFKVCNNTSGSIMPAALTLNWSVI